MPLRLGESVQVRRESWGLLFYRMKTHKVCFVKSGDWLRPEYFDGTWDVPAMVADIAGRTGVPFETIERSLPRLASRLIGNQVITDEVH
jgi:hypothetical protein